MPPILFALQDVRGRGAGPLIPNTRPDLNSNSAYLPIASEALALGSNDTFGALRGSSATEALAFGRSSTIGLIKGIAASAAARFGEASTLAALRGAVSTAAARIGLISTLATLCGAVLAAATRLGQLSTLGARRGAAAAGVAVRVAIAAAIGRGCGMTNGGGFVVASMAAIGRQRGLAVTSPLLFTATLSASAAPASSRTEMAVRVHRDGHPALRARVGTAVADDRDGALSRALRTTAVLRSRR